MRSLVVAGPSTDGPILPADRDRSAGHGPNALSRILGARGILLLAVLLFTARAADAQTISPANLSFAEDAGTASITIVNPGPGNLVVTYSTRDGTATQPADYFRTEGSSGPALRPEGRVVVNIRIIDDNVAEDDEYFFLRINGVDHRITIRASDLSFSLSKKSFAENLGTQARTTLTNTSSTRMRFTLEAKAGTAGASDIRTDRFWFWLNASATREVVMPIVDDNLREGEEYFILNVNGTDIRMYIEANDQPPTTLSIGPRSETRITEGDTQDYTVTLGAAQTQPVTVKCRTLDGPDGAVAGEDYVSVDASLTFAPGETEKTCSLAAIADGVDEAGAETVPFGLADAAGGDVETDGSGGVAVATGHGSFNVTITDNDGPPTIWLEQASPATVSEGTATYEFTVRLSAATGKEDIALGYSFGGTAKLGHDDAAKAGEDYTVSGGTLNYSGANARDGTGQLTIAKGETSKTLEIKIADDQLKELDETIVLELVQDPDPAANQALNNSTNLDDIVVDQNRKTATLTLQSDDAGVVTLTGPSGVVEGDSALFRADLDLDADASNPGRTGTFNVIVGAPGDTATFEDHGAGRSAVTISEGSTRFISIYIEPDNAPEPDETLTVTVEYAGDSRHAASAGTTLVDDGNAGLVSLASEVRAVEGGVAEFVVTYNPEGPASGRSERFDVTAGDARDTARPVSDYEVPSLTVTLVEGVPQSIEVPIVEDGQREFDETFTLAMDGYGSPGGTRAEILLVGTILGDDDLVSLKLLRPDGGTTENLRILEGGGPGEEGPVTATFELDLENPPAGLSGTFNIDAIQRTATAGADYVFAPPAGTMTVGDGLAPQTFSVEVLDDPASEGMEYFEIVLEGTSGATFDPQDAPFEKRFRVSIEDNDGPDPILPEIARYSIARAEASIENQPRLIPMLRDPGDRTEFSLRLTDDGVDSVGGGFRAETVWGATAVSRSADGDRKHEHLLTTLGAHFRTSERLVLGGMLQFDRSEMKPGGEVASGEIVGRGWMAGPYFAARDASQPLFFEGRLLYGRTSNDVEALVLGEGDPARNTSFDSERWLAQARVEGTYRLGRGATLIPLADLSHARDEIDPFPASEDSDNLIGGQTIALTKLQIGAELEIPIGTARGDLRLRPGLRFVASDAGGSALADEENGAEGIRSRGRIDFGIDYRLEDGFVLGFDGFYSGLGRRELESYGAGLDLRLEF